MPWACSRCGTVYAIELSRCPRCPNSKENDMPKNTVHGGDTYEDGPRPPAESVYENPHDPLVQKAKRQAPPPERQDKQDKQTTAEVERERIRPSTDQVERAKEGKQVDPASEGVRTSMVRDGLKADELDGPKDEREDKFKLEGKDNAPTPDVVLTENVRDDGEIKKASNDEKPSEKSGPTRPATNDSKGDWVTYARAVDPQAKGLELKTKAELIAKYGQS